MVSTRGWLAILGFALALIAFVVLMLRLRQVTPRIPNEDAAPAAEAVPAPPADEERA